MLLKEITFRYVPKGQTLEQALWDYYAMSALYRAEGSAGAHMAPRGERRTEVIDNVFGQVQDAVAKLYFQKVKTDPRKYAPEQVKKDLEKLANALRYKDWMEFHAALDSIVKLVKPVAGYERVKKAEMNPKAAMNHLSPDIQKLVGGSTSFDKAEPIPDTPSDEPAVLAVPPAPRKRIIVPPLGKDLAPLDQPFAGKDFIKLEPNQEQFLGNAGFEWDNDKKAYVNTEKGSMIQVNPDYSAEVTTATGTKRKVRNLGKLIVKLLANRGKTNPIGDPSGVPAGAALNEDGNFMPKDFKDLYNYLYS